MKDHILNLSADGIRQANAYTLKYFDLDSRILRKIFSQFGQENVQAAGRIKIGCAPDGRKNFIATNDPSFFPAEDFQFHLFFAVAQFDR